MACDNVYYPHSDSSHFVYACNPLVKRIVFSLCNLIREQFFIEFNAKIIIEKQKFDRWSFNGRCVCVWCITYAMKLKLCVADDVFMCILYAIPTSTPLIRQSLFIWDGFYFFATHKRHRFHVRHKIETKSKQNQNKNKKKIIEMNFIFSCLVSGSMNLLGLILNQLRTKNSYGYECGNEMKSTRERNSLIWIGPVAFIVYLWERCAMIYSTHSPLYAKYQ